jgi:8-oxo-dGTP pyrophosphatase MutT (NUDIX family)
VVERDLTMKRVASIAVKHRDTLLWIRREDTGKWTMPGGHLNEGEDPIDGAKRELYEETGIRAPKGDLTALGSGEVFGKFTVYSFLYEPEGIPQVDFSHDPDGEADEHCWFDDAPDNVHVPNDRNVTLALLDSNQADTDDVKLTRRTLKSEDALKLSKQAAVLIAKLEADMEAKAAQTLKKGQPAPFDAIRATVLAHNPHAGTARDANLGLNQLDHTRYSWGAAPEELDPFDSRLAHVKGVSTHDVNKYHALTAKGSPIPPILVTDEGQRFDVHDGSHRVSAARLANVKVPAYVGRPILAKGVLGAAAGIALSMSPGLKAGFDKVNPPQQEAAKATTIEAPKAPPKWTPDGLHTNLIPIAHLESSFGQNMNHLPNSKGEYHTAFGPLGFKVSTGHEEWTKTNKLKELYPGLEEPKAFMDKFKTDWKFYNLVASSHFMRLMHRHGSPEKAAYAWRWGSTAAKGAEEEAIHKDNYVMRYRDLSATTGIKKAEKPPVI